MAQQPLAMHKALYTHQYQLLLGMLKELRTANGLTQVDLASQLDISQSDVSKIEQGTRRLDVIELRQWVTTLGVSLPVFLHDFEARLSAAPKPYRER